MIVTDTTAVKSDMKNGVVIILQRQQKLLNLSVAQYAGCQHHILDAAIFVLRGPYILCNL